MSSDKRELSPEASPLKGPAPKAVPEDTSDVAFEDGIPLNPIMGDQTVQFISGAPVNGDAKVEIGDSPPPTFVGLGKEELMKYANDPFWVRLRWFLFILFWVLWIAMLVGAVVIIVLAPRCAEKKTHAETFYQVKAANLIKDGKFEEHAQKLKDLGVETIVVSDLLQHDPSGEPEAVTNFEKIDDTVENGLFMSAVKEIKEKGIKLLLQIVPNHSGTRHEWFNDTNSDMYVRQPYDVVKDTPWVTQDNKHTSWTQDPRDSTKAYLQQFSGNVADLNFRNPDVVSKFKSILSHWKEVGFDGFMISKASYLVEDLENLMNRNATRNQPQNVDVIKKIVGMSGAGPNLVELEGASNETVQQYLKDGLVPILKTVNAANTESIRQTLEDLNGNPKAVVNLATSTISPEKARLINLLVSSGGYRTLISQDSGEDPDFIKSLLKFKHANPRGKEAKVNFATKGDVIAVHRSDGDDHLIVANLGEGASTFDPSTLNLGEEKGEVILATPGAQQKPGDPISGEIPLNRLSGLVIKLEKKEVEA